MKRTFPKVLLLLLLVLCMVVPLVSCGGEKGPATDATTDPGEQPTEPGTDPVDPSAETQVITLEQLKQMKIVYPDGSTTLKSSAETLQSSIKSAFGVNLKVAPDILFEGNPLFSESEFEILLGNTNRAASENTLTDLRPDDYGYALGGTKVVIKGGSDEKTATACSAFAYKIVLLKKGKNDGLFFSSDWNETVRADYAAGEVTINEVSLFDYTVVYPENGTRFEKQLADRLADRILALTGRNLTVQSDATAYGGGHEILIGATNRNAGAPATAGAKIAVNDKFVSLTGATSGDYAEALSYMLSRISENAENGSSALYLPALTEVPYRATTSALTYNVYGFNIAPRAANVCNLILRYLPDLLFLQEAENEWMGVFTNFFSEYYDVALGEPRHGGAGDIKGRGKDTYLPVLYAKDRYRVAVPIVTKWLTDTPDEVSLLDTADYYRTVTYTVMEEIATGTRFLVVCNHLDTAAKARETEVQMILDYMQEHYTDLPVIFAGDMNCTVNSAPMTALLATSFASADEYDHSIHAQGGMIDWILYTPDCMEVVDYRICDEKTMNGEMPSDHPAVYAAFTFKVPTDHAPHTWYDTSKIRVTPDPETDFRDPHPLF